MKKKRWFYEVSVSKDGGKPDSTNRFNIKDKVHWVRKGVPRDTFGETQADAIANNERPYRIRDEEVPEHITQGGAA